MKSDPVRRLEAIEHTATTGHYVTVRRELRPRPPEDGWATYEPGELQVECQACPWPEPPE